MYRRGYFDDAPVMLSGWGTTTKAMQDETGWYGMAQDKAIGPFASEELAASAVALANGETPPGLAYDTSGRLYDLDGRLHHDACRISKACVSPYYGREIPDFESLGLQADKIYQLLRDPAELEKGAASFNNLPLLIEHVPITADKHPSNLVVGTTGTDAKFVAPYLFNSLAIWTKDAIEGVEDNEQKELSSAYRYVADMTPGVYEGTPYDGVMRGIVGNHVALVKKGRAGPDVVVGDKAIIPQEKNMAKQVVLTSRAAIGLHGALAAHVLPKLAKDSKIDFLPLLAGVNIKNIREKAPAIWKGACDLAMPMMTPEATAAGGLGPDDIISKLVDIVVAGAPGAPGAEAGAPPSPEMDALPAAPAVDPAAGAGGGDNPELMALLASLGLDEATIAKIVALAGKKAEPAAGGAEPPKKEGADDEELDENGQPKKKATDDMPDNKIDQKAMDAALAANTAALKSEMRAVAEAREFVRPWAGAISMAFDSVESIYKATLSARGIDAKDVKDVAALKLLIQHQPLPGSRNVEKTELALDAAASKSLAERFPAAGRIQL